MKKHFTLLFSILSIAVMAQDPEALWLRHTCGYTDGNSLLGGNVWGDAVCADAFGNSYNSGSFSGFWFTMDTVIDMGENRFYINKYNADGERIWTAKARGTTINSIMTSSRMECDSAGNIYICGTFGVDDSVYMAPNWYPIGSGYIAKYDSDGNNLWCRFAPRTGTTSISFTDMSIGNDQLFASAIMNYGVQSFGDFEFNTNHSQNGLIVKLDLDGNILLAELLDASTTNEIYGIEVSKITNNVYLVGQNISNTNLNIDGLTLTPEPEATNSFLIKMNNNLEAEWLRGGYTELNPLATWGFGEKCLSNLELDKFDNVYAVGNGNGNATHFGGLSFNHLINGGYMQDVYIVKYNTYGEEKWLRFGQSGENDHVRDIMTDEFGNSVLSVYSGFNALGNFSFDGDTIQQWHGGLVKYDPDGNVIYTQQLQEARSLTQLASGVNNTFFATGNGISHGMPYDGLEIYECEDDQYGQSSVDFKMIHVKFFDDYFVESTGIQEIASTSRLHIFPNPSSQFIQVELPTDTDRIFVEIFDTHGRKIHNTEKSSNETIDIHFLPKGLYFVRVSDKSGLIGGGKFIKD